MTPTDKEHKVLSPEQIEAIRLQVGYAAGSERFTTITRAIEAAARAPLLERIAALEAELAGVREDAARYRFAMGDQKTFAVCWTDGSAWWPCLTDGPIDAAIDAVRTGEKP